jgi:hypothetical protein
MFRIVDRSGAAIAASAAVVCLATLSWVVASGSTARGDRHPGGYSVVGGADPSDSTSASRGASASAVGPAALAPDVSATAPVSGGADPSSPVADALVPVPPAANPADGRSRSATGMPTPPAAASTKKRFPSGSPSPAVTGIVGPPGRPDVSPAPADPTPSPDPRRWSPDPLTAGPPQDTPGGQPWCEDVTVTYTNSGTRQVTSGQATLVSQVTDAFGYVWGSYRTPVALPLPIAPGTAATSSYDLCLAPWQVPPGTHLETTAVELVA